MTGELSKNFHGVGITPLSKILAVKYRLAFLNTYLLNSSPKMNKRRNFSNKQYILPNMGLQKGKKLSTYLCTKSIQSF